MGFVAKVRADGTQDTTGHRAALMAWFCLATPKLNSNCFALDQLGDGRIVAGGGIQLNELTGHVWHGMVVMLTANGCR